MDNLRSVHFRPTASNIRAGDMYAVGGGDRLQLCGMFLEEIFRLSSLKTDASLWFVAYAILDCCGISGKWQQASASSGPGDQLSHCVGKEEPVPLSQ